MGNMRKDNLFNVLCVRIECFIHAVFVYFVRPCLNHILFAISYWEILEMGRYEGHPIKSGNFLIM